MSEVIKIYFILVHVVVCQKCSKKFSKVDNLARHMEEAHPVDSSNPAPVEGSVDDENVNPNVQTRTGLAIALKRKWENDSFQRVYELASQVE